MDQPSVQGDVMVFPDTVSAPVPKAAPILETVVIHGDSTTGAAIGGTPDFRE